jgi:hypothetical protein
MFDSMFQADHNNLLNSDEQAKAMENLNSNLQTLLRDLKSALSEALADSASFSSSVQRIRAEGWTLHLVVDRKPERPSPTSVVISAQDDFQRDPTFRIDGRDLSFLQSIGIDPTRRLRNRRHK